MTLIKLIKMELTAIFTNPVVMLTIFAGVIFYSFLYPLPYAQQTPLEQKVTDVNLDNSQLSRKLERMVDATPQVNIVNRAHSIIEAKQQFLEGEVSGVLLIPDHFYRDLLLGKSPTLSYSGDASYFLVFVKNKSLFSIESLKYSKLLSSPSINASLSLMVIDSSGTLTSTFFSFDNKDFSKPSRATHACAGALKRAITLILSLKFSSFNMELLNAPTSWVLRITAIATLSCLPRYS